jgi:hypothetical protein
MTQALTALFRELTAREGTVVATALSRSAGRFSRCAPSASACQATCSGMNVWIK